MSDESKVTREDIMEQLQAGHRARLDGSILQNLNKDSVQFCEVLPNRPAQRPQQPQQAQQSPQIPESYLNYAAQLLEQMRGVYGSSWDNCNCGSSWHGGHNHFYDPCSGADVAPSCGCPVFDCSNTCCNDNFVPPRPPKPQPPCPPPMPDCSCGCGTTTYYDDCAYKLQQLCDQLDRIESMTKEMYLTNQQLFSYIIEYYNNFVATGSKTDSDC